MAEIAEKVMVKRMPHPEDFGWIVSAIRAVGPHKGEEKALAMLCGGNMGKALAALCARHAAQTMMIDTIEIDETED
jgi:hypothetical protein